MKIKQILALFALVFPILSAHSSQLIWTRMLPVYYEGWYFDGVIQNQTEVHIRSFYLDFFTPSPWDYVPSEILDIDVPTYCVTLCYSGMNYTFLYGDYSTTISLYWNDLPPRSGFAGTSDHWNPELGTGWIEGDPFGTAWVRWYPWVYDMDDGWQYVIDSGIAWNANAWWIYSYTRGDWFWTTREVHPWAWSHQQQDWITAPF
jgi:hypothetical protein